MEMRCKHDGHPIIPQQRRKNPIADSIIPQQRRKNPIADTPLKSRFFSSSTFAQEMCQKTPKMNLNT